MFLPADMYFIKSGWFLYKKNEFELSMLYLFKKGGSFKNEGVGVIKIGLASPDVVRKKWSYGEVKKLKAVERGMLRS